MTNWVKKTTGFVRRFVLLLFMLTIALLVTFSSFLTGQIAETTAPIVFQNLLPEFPGKSFLSSPEVFAMILLVPGILVLMLWRQAFRTVKDMLKNASKQAWDFLRGRKDQSGEDTLWAVVQLGENRGRC